MIDFHFDFETRSRLDLRKVGAVRYSTHISTEATLITWAFGRTGTVKAWRIGQTLPSELVDVIINPSKYNFNAFNIEFDFMIWAYAFSRQVLKQGITLVRPPLKNITDTMALSQHFRTGGSLEACARMRGLNVSKDKEGRRMMLKQCKPKRDGAFVELTDEEWIAFERYGKIDTMILREVYYKLPPLPTSERWIFEWTFRRNLTGIMIDTELVDVLDGIVKDNMPRLEQSFFDIVGLKPKSPKCLAWFKPHFPWIENLRADTVRDMLLRCDNVNPIAAKALKLKALAGSTSISKVKCATEMRHNDRLYNLLAYHMAQTKRFAGRGIQIHNFPRPSNTAVDAIPEDLNVHDLASEVRAMIPNLQDPIDFVKNLLRRIWIVEKDKLLYCGDFSKVEPTVLYWLTGMGEVSKTAYEEMAVKIYNMPLEAITKDSDERTIGKHSVLGGGYGMGPDKFKDQVAKLSGIIMEDDFSKHVIKTYREVNAPITKLWKDLEQSFKKAIHGEATALCDKKLYVMPMQAPDTGVQIRLPSGSYLYYHNAHLKVEEKIMDIVEIVNGQTVVRKVPRMSQSIYYMVPGNGGIPYRTNIYGGLLTEHVTSATARDLLTYSMYNLDQAGFDVLTSVHDEVWASAVAGRDDEFNQTMCILPYWAQNIKLTADTGSGVRYLK